MTYHEKDPWQEAADEAGGIEGLHVKCAKVRWLANDVELPTGNDGAKLCIIMPTARRGIVQWIDGKIVGRNTGRYEDGFVMPEVLEGWNPYLSFQCVFADEERMGQLATFTSSAWGSFNAFRKLIFSHLD